MVPGPEETGVPFDILEGALPERAHRHPRAVMADLLLNACLTRERRRLRAERHGDEVRAARLEGEIEAHRRMLKVLFFSTDSFEVTTTGKAVLAYLDRRFAAIRSGSTLPGL